MSDIEYVFNQAEKLKDTSKVIDFIFNSLGDEYDNEAIIELWDKHLNKDNSKIKKMQTGLGMVSMLPTNSVYKGKLHNI